MKNYRELTISEAKEAYASLCASYEEYKGRGLKLDLSRGKPNSEQLDLADGLLAMPLDREMCVTEGGFDARNYGVLDGVPEAKRLFGELLGLNPKNIIVGGNSSLHLNAKKLKSKLLGYFKVAIVSGGNAYPLKPLFL